MTTLLEHSPASAQAEESPFVVRDNKQLHLLRDFPLGCQEVLADLTEAFTRVLGKNLAGLYVHGSLAYGCWNPERSDIDLLAVVDQAMPIEQKTNLLKALEGLWPKLPPKGLEMSIILRDDAAEPFWPMPYQLHYSPGWRSVYHHDPLSLCNYNYKTDRDLAVHLAVAREHGKVLLGQSPQKILAPVPKEQLLRSIWWEIGSSEENILLFPTGVILNLCRGVAFAREGLLFSKAQGGSWAAKAYPHWKWLICRALEDYKGHYCYEFLPEQARCFCRQLLDDFIRYAQQHDTTLTIPQLSSY